MGSGSEDLYNRKISGKLKLKGRPDIKVIKQKPSSVDSDERPNKDRNTAANSPSEVPGTGRIFSSGTTIQGFDTKFVEELAAGDTIIIRQPTSNEYEERTVQSVLSNRTIYVDDAFSRDLITTTTYTIRKKSAEADKPDEKEKQPEENKTLMTVTVREKSGMWSYKTTTKTVSARMTAEDRLNERVKHSRDKYCW